MIRKLLSLFKHAYRYRSSVTGAFVSEDYAKKHPDITIRERVR